MAKYSGAAIRITEADTPFVMVARAALRADLEWDEMGLYAWLMSHDPTFRITEAYIVGARKAGRDAVRRMLQSLERTGFLRRSQNRQANGRMGKGEWTLFWDPVTDDE